MAQLEGPLGALQPETVIRAIIATLRSAPAQPGSRSTRSRRSSAMVNAARAAIADLVGAASAGDVVFGGNQSTLMMQFVAALSADWQLGDNIVVSRLDTDADLQHLLTAARSTGVSVRWGEVDLETGELPEWQYERLITPHTRVVTVPLANPVTGTVPEVRAIADRAHQAGALVVVNTGAALPQIPIDINALGADLLSVAVRTFGGPTISAIVARPGLLSELSGTGVPDGPSAPRAQSFELGSLPVELMDGVTAAVDHLAGLDDAATGSRRQRLIRSLTAANEHEAQVFIGLVNQLDSIRGVTVLGRPAKRIPVVGFTVQGYRAEQVADHLGRNGVAVWVGAHGESELIRTFGADEAGGPVLVGIMPHTTAAEVDALIAGLQKLIHSGANGTGNGAIPAPGVGNGPGSGHGTGALAHAQ
jgi:cysteine desulfurase family protein (TIGR01976 family)